MAVTRRRFLRHLVMTGTSLAATSLVPVSVSGKEIPSPRVRRIPSTGEAIPVVGLGTWLTLSIDLEDAAALRQRVAVVREFLEQGGGVLDSSPMYGVAQEVIGIALKRIGHHRGLFSATKVWTTGNRQGVLQMEESRSLWGLPQLDLIQVHNLLDWKTHLPNLLAMKRDGQLRYVGVTTSHGRRHGELIRIMKTQPLDFVQLTYNLVDREAESYLLPLAQEKGIAVIINRPFQGGGLFDRFQRYTLPPWAVDIDCANWAQFFLKFIISHPAVTCAIPATSRLDHLHENMGAAYGRLPDAGMREHMARFVASL